MKSWIVLCLFPLVASADDLSPWLASEANHAWSEIFANIEPSGAASGIVIASPSRSSPNYYYHWVRDSALTMDQMATLYERTADAQFKAMAYRVLADYAALSRNQQRTPNLTGAGDGTGIGEPKFNVDGSPYLENWGRPQNDGPALRALALIRFAAALLREGHADAVHSLYDSALPTNSVIKADLEYVAHHWMEPCFDLWEETLGIHFYTRMVQRRALIEGAMLADVLNDSGAAAFYRQQAQLLGAEIRKHWDGRIIRATLDAQNDPECGPKTSGLDVAVILGALHGCVGDGFFCPSSPEVLATAQAIRAAFQALYPINQITTDPAGEPLGTAIGRYPEDCYDGSGSPRPAGAWFIATQALAELDYRVAREQPDVASVYVAAGDAELRRAMVHAGTDGAMSEQFNRDNGFLQSARDLTWSYASFLSAALWRP